MLEQVTTLEDVDFALPTASLDLSTRMRDLRNRQGLKQSEVARRMGLDPSIPSLWEQGKRLVPANRLRALAEALEVSIEELLEGISGTQRAPKASVVETTTVRVTSTDPGSLDERSALRHRTAEAAPLLRLLPTNGEDSATSQAVSELAPPEPWVVPERP